MPSKTTLERPERRQMALVPSPINRLSTADKISSSLSWTNRDVQSGRFRTQLYRFLADQIPSVSACIWTWVRLTAAPGRFELVDSNSTLSDRDMDRLNRLTVRLAVGPTGQPLGLSSLLAELLVAYFRDGCFGGFLTVRPDGSSIDRFIPIDPANLQTADGPNQPPVSLEIEERRIRLDRPDFFLLPHNSAVNGPLGQSILHAVPFIAYIEQQLVDDMRRSSHNAGFHRLHVKVTPPERIAGESDEAYTNRINEYFDATVRMIKTCEIDDNPVTWNNIDIDHIGPEKSRDVTNSWFMSHRAMIEEICAGTNLSPYLLGYSYGATTTWANFKFDVVMRQVRAIQTELAGFLEWVGNIELALSGSQNRCRWQFDNSFAYQAKDEAAVQSSRVDSLLKLYDAGLIDKETAKTKAGRLV